MEPLTYFRDAHVVRQIARETAHLHLSQPVQLMEVCGGHTAAIYRYALHDLLPPEIKLISGPGCPVCVTSNDFIDRAISLAMLPDVTIATFGDLIRVPGSTRSLADMRARGADVRVFYSPADALEWAKAHSERTLVFLGIGFETTACTLAATIAEALRNKVENFSLLSALKTMPEALRVLFTAPDAQVDGLILPGHVTTIVGWHAFEFIAREFSIPCVVSGFEPVDLMETILMLCRQVAEKRASIENQYRRVVQKQGNVRAQELIREMFEPCDMSWRGFGVIPESGLKLRSSYSQWDAENVSVEVEPTQEDAACRCGDVLRGRIHPTQCALFGTVCTPDTPRGACMVSAEGACSAVYQFSSGHHGQ